MGSKGSDELGRETGTGAGRNTLLLDIGGERADLNGSEEVEVGEGELRRSCWGSSGLDGGKIRSIIELCMIAFGFD